MLVSGVWQHTPTHYGSGSQPTWTLFVLNHTCPSSIIHACAGRRPWHRGLIFKTVLSPDGSLDVSGCCWWVSFILRLWFPTCQPVFAPSLVSWLVRGVWSSSWRRVFHQKCHLSCWSPNKECLSLSLAAAHTSRDPLTRSASWSASYLLAVFWGFNQALLAWVWRWGGGRGSPK